MHTLPICAAALVAALTPCLLDANTLDVPSHITRVELYDGQARVTRSFDVDLPAGQESALRFSGVPNSSQLDSTQFAVIGGAPLVFGTARADDTFTPDDLSQAARDLRTKVEELTARHDRLQKQREIAADRAKQVQDLADSVRKGIAETGQKDLYDLARSMLDDVGGAQLAAFDAQQKLDAELRDVNRDLQEAKRKLQEQLDKEKATSTKITIEATSAQGGTTHGTFTYVVRDARWQPHYIVRATPGQKQVEIVYQAAITQSTGEDWDNATIVLNTGSPGLGGSPIKPPPVYLERYEPRPVPVEQTAMDFRKAAKAEYAMAAPPPPAITATTTGFSATLPSRATVPTGGRDVLFPIITQTFDADFWSRTIPATAERAYLAAKFRNGFELPILAGEAQLFVDGAMTGAEQLDTTLPGNDIELGLGVNQNLVVKRTTVTHEGDTTGFISKSRVERRTFLTKITNNMPIEQRVVMEDSVPVSHEKDIEVDLLSPKDVKVDPDTGLFKVELTIKPGETAQVTTDFKVTYPKDWQVTGGY